MRPPSIRQGFPYLISLGQSGARKWIKCFNCCNAELSTSEIEVGADALQAPTDIKKYSNSQCNYYCCDCDTYSLTWNSFNFCGCGAELVAGTELKPNRETWIALGLSGFVFFSMIMVLLVFWSLEKQRKSGKKVLF